MENLWICVYRDTVEEHNENDNLAEILVTENFAKQYFNERFAEDGLTFNDFLNEYTADWTEDFYSYAMKHNAVIEIRPLNWEDIEKNLLESFTN